MHGRSFLRKWFSRTIAIGLAVYLPVAAVAFVSNQTVDSEEYAAILLSAHAMDYKSYFPALGILQNRDYWAPPFAFLGSFPMWTFYFNARDQKTNYVFNATAADFYRVLTDEACKSIVFVGHGSFNSIRLTDDMVTNLDIEKRKESFREKAGEWIQLSCAAADYSPIHIGTLVAAPENTHHYAGETAGTFDFVIDALTAFQRIKSSSGRRIQ